MQKTLTLSLSLLFCSAAQLGFTQWTVQETAPMLEFRNGHTATTFDEGKALICGGYNGNVITNSAEVYDYAIGDWLPASPMISARFTHKSILLNNGEVLVTGGWDGGKSNFASTELYDPVNEEFEEGPDMSTGRSNHTLTELNDGRILIAGGYNGSIDQASCDIYNPETNSIIAAEPMIAPRSSHTATLLADGRVLVVAGFNPDYGFQMNDSEIYDPETDSWSEVEPVIYARDNHAAVLLNSGHVLVVGGRFFNGGLNLFEGEISSVLFDPETNDWTELVGIPQGQSYLEMFNVIHEGMDYVLLPGSTNHSGIEVDLTYSNSFSTMFEEGVQTDFWQTDFGSTVEGRYRYAACNLEVQGSNVVMVCGGDDAGLGAADLYSIPFVSVEESVLSEMKIFPVPNHGNFTIQSNELIEKVNIFSFTGALLRELTIESRQNKMSCNLSDFPVGIYLIEIQAEKRIIRRTFVMN